MRSQARDFSLEVGGSLPCLHGQSNACRAARAAHRSVRARTFASWPWPGLSFDVSGCQVTHCLPCSVMPAAGRAIRALNDAHERFMAERQHT